MPAEIKGLIIVLLACVGVILISVVGDAVVDSIKASHGITEVCK